MDTIGPKMCPGLKTKANFLVQCLGTFASCKISVGKVGVDIPQDLNYSEVSGPYLFPSLCCLLTPVQPSSNTKSLTSNKRKMLMQSMSSRRPKVQGAETCRRLSCSPMSDGRLSCRAGKAFSSIASFKSDGKQLLLRELPIQLVRQKQHPEQTQ